MKKEAKRQKAAKSNKELIEAQMKREAGDRNRTQSSYSGPIEVTALKEPTARRQTRSLPRTSKAVTDALVKKSSRRKKTEKPAKDRGNSQG